jgi:hypothetical protein
MLRLDARGYRPLIAGSVDANGVGGEAVKVKESPGVRVEGRRCDTGDKRPLRLHNSNLEA